MSTTTGAYAPPHEPPGRTPAQWYCLVVGPLLLALGAFGFLVNSSFAEASFGLDFGDEDLNGDLFLGLEVNGWHNVVHLATGALLLLAAFAAPAARTVALVFGLSYALVAVIGFIDSSDVLEFVAVNLAANLFHAVLAASAVAAALLSRTHRTPA